MALMQAAREITMRTDGEARRRRGASDRRSLMRVTDEAIGWLEELNLAGRGTLPPDPGTVRMIESALAVMPADACRRFGGRATVQEALDGFFDVQEALLLAWQRDVWSAGLGAA